MNAIEKMEKEKTLDEFLWKIRREFKCPSDFKLYDDCENRLGDTCNDCWKRALIKIYVD